MVVSQSLMDRSLPIKHLSSSTGGQTLFCEFVFEKIVYWRSLGKRAALLTLVNIEGSSPRPVGSQMAVNSDGDFVGLISGGCLEAALIAEAQVCIAQGLAKCVRYGRDSDYFDLQLPCGSGLDVLFQPLMKSDVWVDQLCSLYNAREPLLWHYDFGSRFNVISTFVCGRYDQAVNPQYSRQQLEKGLTSFERSFLPRHRVVVVGEGEIFEYFILLSQYLDIEVEVYSSESTGLCLGGTVPTASVSRSLISDWRVSSLDRWTSLVVLSHDHSWEHSILMEALSSEVAFISVLGSKLTHMNRCRKLIASGVDEHCLEMIKGPAGLDIGGRNPPEIALSILTEVVARKNSG